MATQHESLDEAVARPAVAACEGRDEVLAAGAWIAEGPS